MLSMKMLQTFDTILIATGSEVNLAVAAAKELASQGGKVRVVSMPSTDVFDAQDVAYKEEILPNAVRRRVAVEMGATQTGINTLVLMEQFSVLIPLEHLPQLQKCWQSMDLQLKT